MPQKYLKIVDLKKFIEINGIKNGVQKKLEKRNRCFRKLCSMMITTKKLNKFKKK